MNYSYLLGSITFVFFVLLLIAMRGGIVLGRARQQGEGGGGHAGAGVIEGAVFALLGLLLAFTFSGAAQRMAERRNLIVAEVNAIGTAWLRIQLLDSADQRQMRNLFRRYVDGRLDYYHHVADVATRDAIAARATVSQNEIWAAAITAKNHVAPPFSVAFISAVNDMFDSSTTLTVAQNTHPPPAIYLFLGVLALLCACLVGLNLASSGNGLWFHQLLYAAVMTAALYVIVDLEFPRIGYIRIDAADALLQNTRDSMGGLENVP